MNLTDEDFSRIVTHIKDEYGIDLRQKRLLVEGRLAYTVRSYGFKSFKEYIDFVLSDRKDEKYISFINKLTTNHTYFMREMEHFDYFMNEILPYIEKTVTDKDVRIWSAGCSYGHEPYNLAMCIDEYFGERKPMWDLKILATDISSKALTAAKKGIYKDSELYEVPPDWKNKYFTRYDDKHYQVVDSIRKEVVFKYLNLMEDFNHKKPFDLILCRNVMIYFDAETRAKLIDKLYEETKPGGFLLIGHAENISKNTKFEMIKPSIFRKQ